MSHDREIERILDHWFSDGPDEVPDRVLDVVAERIDRQRQQPAWRLDRRFHPVNTYIRFGVAMAAVLILAVGGLMLLRPSSPNVGGLGPTPSATATSSPTALPTPHPTPYTCEDGLPGCAGPLFAGAHHSSRFGPRIYLTTPDGWVNSIDQPTIYKLDPPDAGGPSILVWYEASIANQTASCDPIAKPGVGSSSKDWIDYVTKHPGLDVSDPVAVDLDGSKGQAVDISLAADWKATCPTHAGQPYVMLLTNALGGEYGVSADQRLHLVAVDNVQCKAPPATCVRTVVIQTYGPADPTDFAASSTVARSIIDTFSFGCGVAFRRSCG